MDRGRAKLLATALEVDSDLWKKFEIKFSDRMGDRIIPGSRDWDPDMPDAAVTLNYDNDLDLTFETRIRAMRGDLIATTINTGDFSRVDSLNSAKSTRHDSVTTRRTDRNETSE